MYVVRLARVINGFPVSTIKFSSSRRLHEGRITNLYAPPNTEANEPINRPGPGNDSTASEKKRFIRHNVHIKSGVFIQIEIQV